MHLVLKDFLLDRAGLNNVVLFMLTVHQALPKLHGSEPKTTNVSERCRSSYGISAFGHSSNRGAIFGALGSGSCPLPFGLAK